MTVPFTDINRILVIKLRHIGDVLLTVPVFRALRETFPEASLTALVNRGTESVLTENPLIDSFITLDRSVKKLPMPQRHLRELAFLRNIRKEKFDMTVDLTGGDRAAIISLVSGARHRLGWQSKKGFLGKKLVYTHLTRPDNKQHMVLQNLAIVRSCGIDTRDLAVDFHFSSEERGFVHRILAERGIAERAPIVHIHPPSRWLFKCWQDEYMAEVIRRLLDRRATVFVTSSPDKRELDKTLRILSLVGDSPSLIALPGKTTIKQLGAIAAESDLFFGVDSAPMHIAAAVGTPVVALFGPTGVYNWGPWSNDASAALDGENLYPRRNGVQAAGSHIAVQMEWPCVPCGKDGCNGTKMSRCLEDISVDQIFDFIIEALKEKLQVI
jgi:heptosyltransferase-3